MRSKRVPVLKLGSRGPWRRREVVELCPQSVRKAFASVRNRSQSFAKRPRRVGHAGETNDTKIVPKRRMSSLFMFRITKVSTVTRIGGVVVAKPRTVVTFGLVASLCVSKVSTVTRIGGVVVAKPRTVVTFGLVASLCVSKVSTVTGMGGVVVAKPRTVVTFRLLSGLRVEACYEEDG